MAPPRSGRNGCARQKLARAYRELGATELAWVEFVRAADLLPDDAGAQLDAAEALLVTGQFEDAKAARREDAGPRPEERQGSYDPRTRDRRPQGH